MTVIRRKKQNFNYPNSANASDTESLHLGSNSRAESTESLNTQPAIVTAPRRRERHSLEQREEDPHISRKNCGKKKQRRIDNRTILQTLNEEDETEENGTAVIMEPYKSPFARLLENPDALAYWNLFIQKPEEEQNKIINSYSDIRRNVRVAIAVHEDRKEFFALCHEIKGYMSQKRYRAYAMMDGIERFLLDSFKSCPDKPISKNCDSQFEKRLMYALAEYHQLRLEDTCEHEDGFIVNVSNPLGDSWSPSECPLTDFISQLRR